MEGSYSPQRHALLTGAATNHSPLPCLDSWLTPRFGATSVHGFGAVWERMIFVVDAGNRKHFAADLAAMHRQRKIVFVDRAGWNLSIVADQEIDQYDHLEDTLYLLSKPDPTAPVLASVRLLTTTGPHLMCELFSADRERMPRGPTVWEASRFCTAPAIQASAGRHALLWEVICGIMEAGLTYGFSEVIFAASRALLPLALNCGWDARTLHCGLSKEGDKVTVIAAVIAAAGLRRVRKQHGVSGSVAQLPALSTFHRYQTRTPSFTS